MKTLFFSKTSKHLEYRGSHPLPTPQKGEILIKVHSAGLSPSDLHLFSGEYDDFIDSHHPFGTEFSGVIEEIGTIGEEMASIVPFSLGDAVCGVLPLFNGTHQNGSWSEYICCDIQGIVKIPSQITLDEAAASIGGGLLAYTALMYHCHASAGESLLLCGCAGPQYELLICLALYWKLRVFCTVSTNDQELWITNKWDNVTAVNTTKDSDWNTTILTETGHCGVDYIINADGTLLFKLVQILASRGHILTTAPSQPFSSFEAKIFHLKGASYTHLFEHSWLVSPTQRGRILHIFEEIVKKISEKHFSCTISKIFPYEQYLQALEYAQTTHPLGKVLVSFNRKS